MPVRSGAQYLASLKGTREVWLAGERIKDVTAHPALRRGAEAIARLYDMQHDPAYQEILTYPSPSSGEPVGVSFLLPRTPEELVRRRQQTKAWADESCGMMGRMPDFCNAAVASFAESQEFFAEADPRFGENVVRYYEYCRENDICLTHALIDPQTDRSRGPSEQEDPYLCVGIVRETDAGLIVRGARMLATLAPFANELVVWPYAKLGEKEGAYALAFAIPLATAGLKFICRESYDTGKNSFDRPLSSRFEELDALVIFNDVLIPWERVFFKGNVGQANSLRARTSLLAYAGHQALVRTIAKAEFVIGVACLLVEAIGVNEFLHVQEKIGELISYTQVLNACVRASEADAAPGPLGFLRPAGASLRAAMLLLPRIYPRMIEIIQLLGASGLIMTPTEADFHSPIAPDLRKYFRGKNASAEEKAKLFKLAWDLAGEAFGSRQVLYERFYSGDPVRNLAGLYLMTDKTPYTDKVKRLLNRT
jgi:4-hydroxyphenylacetate 3-monooxygenase